MLFNPSISCLIIGLLSGVVLSQEENSYAPVGQHPVQPQPEPVKYPGEYPSYPTSPQRKYLTPQDYVSMPRPDFFVASNEGDRVIYSATSWDEESDQKTTKVQILDVRTKKVKDITSLTTDDFSDPTFIGKNRVAFISSRNGKPNYYSIDLSIGESSLIQHTNFTFEEINSPKLDFQNGKLIFATGVKVKEFKKTHSSAMAFEKLYIRDWDKWYDYTHQHVHVADFKLDKIATEAKDLLVQNKMLESPVAPFYDSSCFSMSPDGKYVVFTTRPYRHDDAWKTTLELYLVPTEGEPKLELISEKGKGAIYNPKFTPDGKSIVYIQQRIDNNESDKGLITIYNLQTKEREVLNYDWNLNPSSFDFSNDGTKLYISIEDDGHTRLYEFDLKTRVPKAIVKKGTTYLVSELDNQLLVSRSTSKNPEELYIVDKNGHNLKMLSDINDSYLKPYHLNDHEPFYFYGALNERVQGFIIRPPYFDPAKKYPVAFWVHGGPEIAYNDAWMYRWNYQVPAAAGYVTVIINFHGSIGFGDAFTKSIYQHYGTIPFEDLMKGLDYALKKYPFLDENRMVAWGASYGAYMINFMNGHTNRFKALVTHDGEFDTGNIAYSTDELFFFEFEFGGIQWEPKQKELLKRESPVNFVTKWQTPTLVIHGAHDYRVPDAEGIATFTALQRQGIPSRFLYFPDENHWVLKRANSLRWNLETLAWSNKWINHTAPFSIEF